ncbi:MAG: crosslink repair DNA glycosylase YcaQ family protein [Chthoniobacter sp.]|nr:crosslink repair DNA glycosylase YcaQ family protein [Chthoniobacter sp.]
MFIPTVVLDGQVAGTWKRTLKKTSVAIETTPFTSFTKATRRAMITAAKRYGQFVGRTVDVIE